MPNLSMTTLRLFEMVTTYDEPLRNRLLVMVAGSKSHDSVKNEGFEGEHVSKDYFKPVRLVIDHLTNQPAKLLTLNFHDVPVTPYYKVDLCIGHCAIVG